MGTFSALSFLIIIAAVAFYAYKRSTAVDSSNEEGYFLGGRSLTGFAIASTIIMTNLSTEQIVGQNGQSFKVGMEVMAWEVTAAITLVILALVFLPRYFKYRSKIRYIYKKISFSFIYVRLYRFFPTSSTLFWSFSFQ